MGISLKSGSKLKDIQKEIVRLRAERNFSTDIMHITLLLVEEMGEMVAQVRRPFIDGKDPLPPEDKSSLQHEIADVFILLNALAAKAGIDIEEAWLSKENINDHRTWKK